MDHGAQALDVTVVPRVHVAQVRTERAGVSGLTEGFLQKEEQESEVETFSD